MNILVINAGSSSLKYQFLDIQKNSVLTKGNIERVGVKGSSVKNHTQALQSLVKELEDVGYGLSTIGGIGHRVVHGGEYFQQAVLIDDDVLSKIEECSILAPLHNPANLECIRACSKLLLNIPQVAVFDTSFHQTMEPAHYLYPIPYTYYKKYGIRRYGFHGTSHQFVYDKLVTSYEGLVIGKKPLKVITCHIGNGASITAIKDGKVLETSMGMTPLEGLMMGTRSGNIDPAIVTHLVSHEGLTVRQVEDMLDKESGLLGISGVSSDMRDILAGIERGDKKCVLALDMYINSLVKYVGAYTALLGGVDVIVLTAGIMEHRTIVRTMFLEKLAWMGVKLDISANQNDSSLEKIVSSSDSKIMVVVIPTNEELMIAQQTMQLLRH